MPSDFEGLQVPMKVHPVINKSHPKTHDVPRDGHSYMTGGNSRVGAQDQVTPGHTATLGRGGAGRGGEAPVLLLQGGVLLLQGGRGEFCCCMRAGGVLLLQG